MRGDFARLLIAIGGLLVAGYMAGYANAQRDDAVIPVSCLSPDTLYIRVNR